MTGSYDVGVWDMVYRCYDCDKIVKLGEGGRVIDDVIYGRSNYFADANEIRSRVKDVYENMLRRAG